MASGGTRAASPFIWLALAAGAVVLAVEPAIWLVETWSDPAYDSAGGHFFAVAVGLAAWSASSPGPDDSPPIHLWRYVAATAVLRVAGHVLAIPVLGALVLPVDVYVLGRLAGLGRRRRAVSPFWLAVLVGLTLPVEHIVKRLAGYGLRHLAADGACSLLQVAYSEVTCAGVEIALRGRRVFVDLPCSGARGLLLFSLLFAGLAAVVRPSARESAVGFGLAVLAAAVVNSLRIALLAAGLAHEPSLGVDVMRQPWHMAVGLGCLPVGFLPLSVWAHRVSGPVPSQPDDSPDDRGSTGRPAVRLLGAVGFFVVAVVISFAPRSPVDGADVARADSGPHTLLVVETSTPLRHLHAPDQWLGDAGYTVEKIGETHGPLPAAGYRVEAPDGRRWRLDVTFVSERGRIATTAPEAVWYWLGAPKTTWRAFQRFHPLDASPSRVAEFDRQLARAFDIPTRRIE